MNRTQLKRWGLNFLRVTFIAVCLGLPFAESLTSQPAPQFPGLKMTEKATELGIHFNHNKSMEWVKNYTKLYPHLTKWFQAVSASVAVADVNNDGWQDVFFSSAAYNQPSHLYINQQGQGFVEQAKDYGLDKIPNPIRSIFLDCDNDDELEFFTSTAHCPMLYKKNPQGRYEELYQFPQGNYCLFTTAINVLDYNKDGRLDIIFGNLTRNRIPNSPVDADNGGTTVLFKNEGQCRFSVDQQAFGHRAQTHVNTIGVGDIFNDGSQDIWMATDFNNDWIYKQNGQTYQKMNPLKTKTLAHNGMSSEWAYLDDEHFPFIFISHIFEPGYFTAGNMLWTAVDGQLKDFGQKLGVDRCGWSWGSKFTDFNNDSFIDLAVANGFISNEDHSSAFFRVQTASTMPRELVARGAIWKSMNQMSYAGHQRDCFFMNHKNEKFYDLAQTLGFDDEKLDGRGVASADFNNDGRMDLVVANQRQRPFLYINESETPGQWIGFHLKGSSDNKTGIGANIIVRLKGGRVLREALFPFNGYSSQSDSRIHFGLGQEVIEDVKVRWLDGSVQNVDHYQVNAYNEIVQKNSQGVDVQ